MSEEFSRVRRFAVAFAALVLAGTAFRNQVADALIIRGDDYLYRGNAAEALERYRRSLSIAPYMETAADRYVFVSMQANTAASLRAGIAVASRYLAVRPDDAAIRFDRALCYLHERKFSRAQRDFEQAGRIARDASYYVFAGWAAEHAGRPRAARILWTRALVLRPGYRPALIALSEHPE